MSSLENRNAFFPSGSSIGRSPHARPSGPNLARILTPLRATFARNSDETITLAMEPMRLDGARRPWIEGAPIPGTHTLVVDLDAGRSPDRATLVERAEAAGLAIIDAFGTDTLVLDDSAFAELAEHVGDEAMLLVRIEGPIEAADAEAIRRAVAAKASPLDAELRALAALETSRERAVTLTTRDEDLALRFVAENLSCFVSAIAAIPAAEVARPDLGLVHRLLNMTGAIQVRPIETAVYSTAIDVGISIDPSGAPRPAVEAVIYDLYANTWHG